MRVVHFSPRWLYTILFVLCLSLNSLALSLHPQAPARQTVQASQTPAVIAAAASGGTAGGGPGAALSGTTPTRPAMATTAGVAESRTVVEEGPDVGPERDLPPGKFDGDTEVLQPPAEDFLNPSDLEKLLPPESPQDTPRPQRPRTARLGDGGGTGGAFGGGRLLWPIGGDLTSRFGPRHGRWHTGIDIAGPTGSEIRAAESGVVVLSDWYGGYGRAVIIDHGNGISTLYGHCSKLLVTEGQHVERAQVIALRGNSGRSTGPHLHFEVRVNGDPVNPLRYFR